MSNWKDKPYGKAYIELKEKGICVECKNAPAKEGWVRCEACQELNRQRVKESMEFLKKWRKKYNIHK